MSLDQLKQIRKRRMERTYVELQVKRAARNRLQEELVLAHQALDAFKQWRLEHQNQLFNGLHETYLSTDDMHNYTLKLDKMKKEEQELRQHIPRLESQVKEADVKVQQTKLRLQSVSKDLEKVNEFLDMEKEDNKLADNKSEEASNEEIASLCNNR